MPPAEPPLREVVVLPGDHSLKAGAAQVGPAVTDNALILRTKTHLYRIE